MCWNDLSGNGITSFFYERCCDIRFGPNIRVLPAFWTRKLELEFHDEVRIVLAQAPVEYPNRTYSWDENGVITGRVRRWTPLYGVVWEDRAGRVMLNTRLLHSLRNLHGRPLVVLDIASGLGLNVIAAAKSELVGLAVGVDADEQGVAQAKGNVRRNDVENAHIIHFDVCAPPEVLEQLITSQVPAAEGRRVRFDLITMSGLHAPPRVIESCAYELLYALGGSVATFLDSDTAFFGGSTYKYGNYPGFHEYAVRRGIAAHYRGHVDVGALHGTDEEPFLAILPVDVWVYNGRDFGRPPDDQGFPSAGLALT